MYTAKKKQQLYGGNVIHTQEKNIIMDARLRPGRCIKTLLELCLHYIPFNQFLQTSKVGKGI